MNEEQTTTTSATRVATPTAQKKLKNLIFDFDGVLADTMDVYIKSRTRSGISEEAAYKQMHDYFNAQPIHSKNSHLSEKEIKSMQEWVLGHGSFIAQIGYVLFEDFISEIKKIQNTRMAVVSSGSKNYIQEPLLRSELSLTHVLTFEDHHAKEEKIERICKDWNCVVEDVYYFTDTLTDVYELQNYVSKDKLIGCAWGYSGYDKLTTVLSPEHILRDFKDIHKLFVD